MRWPERTATPLRPADWDGPEFLRDWDMIGIIRKQAFDWPFQNHLTY